MSLVGAGFGITLLTEASAGFIIAGLVYREVRDGAEPAAHRLFRALARGQSESSPASFLKVLGERYPLPTADV